MADPRFHRSTGPHRLAALAAIAEAELAPGADPERLIADVATVENAGPDDIVFVENRKYLAVLAASRAGACVARPEIAPHAPPGMALLLTEKPHHGFARIAQALYPEPPLAPGIAPSAVVDPTARIDPAAEIAAGAVIGPGAEIGPGCRIGANAVIGAAVVVGAGSMIGALASLSHCLVGRGVIVLPGARIGQDGFGFALAASGHVKVPQLGRVIVEDEVEIGANVTIDRGAIGDTVIGHGAKIDNLVQIGHNVVVGPRSVIVAQAGVAGSTRLGEGVALAAQSGVAGHLEIGAGARVGAKSGVMRDLAPGTSVFGIPAMPVQQFWRRMLRLNKLADVKDE